MNHDLRHWMDIVLCEAERRMIAARHVGYPNEPFPVEVYIDPSKHDLLRIIRNDPFHSARLIRGLDGHVYASTANLTHVDLWTSLGFPLSDFGKVKDDRQLVQGNGLEFVYGNVGRDQHSQAKALRQWTQVVTEEASGTDGAALSEAKSFVVSARFGDVQVWENPSEGALEALMQRFDQMRGVTDRTSFWVWPAFDATHAGVQRALPVEINGHFYLVHRGMPPDGDWSEGWSFHSRSLTLWCDRDHLPRRLAGIFREPDHVPIP